MNTLALLSPECVKRIDAFESAQQVAADARLEDHLPERLHPSFLALATEMVRIDLEYSWQRGTPRKLEEYRSTVPEVFADPSSLAEITFEDYRLHAQHQQPISPNTYSRRYGVATADWPQQELANASHNGFDGSINDLGDEALRGATADVDYPQLGSWYLNFELLSELGRGTFSRVYLARQADLANRLVVLKLSSANSLEPEHLARLQHTNIVPIYSAHQEHGLHAVCMPYFGDKTLVELLKLICHSASLPQSGQELMATIAANTDATVTTGRTNEHASKNNSESPSEDTRMAHAPDPFRGSNFVDSIVFIVSQVADGLAHAHERGIVHRDLKPANILLARDGRPMILDFNLSDDVIVHGRSSLMVGGTLPYMAPEHLRALRSGGQVTFASDIYSLGVLLFELLAGERPFATPAGGFHEMVDESITIRSGPPPSPRDFNRQVPASIGSIVQKCLAPDPRERYQAVADLRTDLQLHLRHQPLKYAPNRSLPERCRKWMRRHPRLSSAGGVGTLAAVMLLVIAGLWSVREARMDRLAARNLFQEFQTSLPDAKIALSFPEEDAALLEVGLQTARDALLPYDALDNPRWRELPAVANLDEERRGELNAQLAHLTYLMARAETRRSQRETLSDQKSEYLEEAARLLAIAQSATQSPSIQRTLSLRRAELSSELGRDDETQQFKSPADPTSPVETADGFLTAQRLIEERRFNEVLPRLQAMRDRHPTDPVAWLLLGRVQMLLNQPHEAEGCYTTCLALRPDVYLAYLHRGRCRMELKKYRLALHDFDRVLDSKPGLSTALLNRALVHVALHNDEQAEADFTAALDSGTTPTRVFFERSRVRERLGDAGGAELDRQEGLQRTPADELSWVARGIEQLNDDPAAALADFRQAHALNPQSKPAMQNLVHVLADRLHRYDEAEEVLDALVALCADDADAIVGRAVLKARTGRRQAALEDIALALRAGRHPQVFFQAACAVSLVARDRPGDARRAVALLTQAVQQDPRLLDRAKTDPDLEALRELPEFQQLVDVSNSMRKLKSGR